MIHEDYNRDVHDILSRLAYTRSIKSLVPNTTELEIICDINILHSLFFIHDNLRKLSIEFSDESPGIHFYDIFCSILPRIPNLVALSLTRNEESGDLKNEELPYQDEFISALRQLVFLENLCTTGFKYSQEMMDCLVSLPNLKTLVIDVASSFTLKEHVLETVASATNTQMFPRLKHFTIYSDLAFFNHLISMRICPPNVESLEAVVVDEAMNTVLEKCFQRLAADWVNLSTLSLSFEFCTGEKLLHSNALQALSTLHHMRYFYLDGLTAITDSELSLLVENWPQLSNLFLRMDLEDILPRLTLSVLASIAKLCKNIKCISLCVDATQHCDIPHDVPVMEHLEQVSFGFSPISDPEMVALTLDRVCPLICEVKATDGRPANELSATYQRGWIQVSKSLKLIHDALKQRNTESQDRTR